MSAERKTPAPSDETPIMAELDWDTLDVEDIADRGDTDAEGQIGGESPGELADEDDDNAYGESDDALPDDREERVISRNPGKDEGRFDDV